MAVKNEVEKLARIWIEGWIAGKVDEIPLASNFVNNDNINVSVCNSINLEFSNRVKFF